MSLRIPLKGLRGTIEGKIQLPPTQGGHHGRRVWVRGGGGGGVGEDSERRRSCDADRYTGERI